VGACDRTRCMTRPALNTGRTLKKRDLRVGKQDDQML